MVIGDLTFMWNGSDSLYTSMPSPSVDFQRWINAMCEAPLHWKRTFNRIALSFKGKDCRHSANTVSGEQLLPAPLLPVHASELCTFICSIKQQLLTHMCKLHSYRNPIHYRMKSTICIRCNKQYHSRQRLFKHLTNRQLKNKCFDHYSLLDPMTSEELTTIEASCPIVDSKAFQPPPVQLV